MNICIHHVVDFMGAGVHSKHPNIPWDGCHELDCCTSPKQFSTSSLPPKSGLDLRVGLNLAKLEYFSVCQLLLLLIKLGLHYQSFCDHRFAVGI